MKPRHSSVTYVSYNPSMLHASQMVHPLCAKLHAGYPIAVQFVAAQMFTFCTMPCHYLSCRCPGNHSGSGRPHHSDISIHAGYMILACQRQAVLANMLQVIVCVSESALKRCKAQFMSVQTAVKRLTAGTFCYFAEQLC